MDTTPDPAATPVHLRPAPVVHGTSAAGWSQRCSGCGRSWSDTVTKAPGTWVCDGCAKRRR